MVKRKRVVLLDLSEFHTYVTGILNQTNPAPDRPIYTASSNPRLAETICAYVVVIATRNIYKSLRGERILSNGVNNFFEFFNNDKVLMQRVGHRAKTYALRAIEQIDSNAYDVEVTSDRTRNVAEFPLIFTYHLERDNDDLPAVRRVMS